MGLSGPPGLSAEQQASLWSRWKAGYPMRDIGRALRVDHGSIRNVLCIYGGIVPAARVRSRIALTLAERETISRGIAGGESIRSMARRLSRSASTVSREMSRHGGRSAYRATRAERRAWRSALRP